MTATGVGPDAGPTRLPAQAAGPGTGPDRTVPAGTGPGSTRTSAPTDAPPRLLKVFGGIIAPTSLLTGLLFYFGRSRGAGYYRYFRVNSTVLDLTHQRLPVLAGVDGLFVPIAVASLLALVLPVAQPAAADPACPPGRATARRPDARPVAAVARRGAGRRSPSLDLLTEGERVRRQLRQAGSAWRSA